MPKPSNSLKTAGLLLALRRLTSQLTKTILPATCSLSVAGLIQPERLIELNPDLVNSALKDMAKDTAKSNPALC